MSAFLPECHTCGLYTPNSRDVSSTEQRGKWLQLRLSKRWMLFLIERWQNTPCITHVLRVALHEFRPVRVQQWPSALKLVHRTVEECGLVWFTRLSSHHVDDHVCVCVSGEFMAPVGTVARRHAGKPGLQVPLISIWSIISCLDVWSMEATPSNRTSGVCC